MNEKFKSAIIFVFMTIVISGAFDAFGKRWRSPVIAQDTAFMEMVYIHVNMDPKDDNRERADYEMLAVGDEYLWYGGYGDYQLDSIGLADPEWKTVPTREDFRKLRKECEPIVVYMLTNLRDSTLTYYGRVFINYYRYEEPVPQFDWKYEDETREVMGYECRKATTRWRGRDWTAWYSEIPVSAGPWKFNGLPGLILRLEDSKGEHMFEAVDSKDHVYPIGWRRKSIISKTTREKYNADLRDYKENAGAMMVDSGMVQVDENRGANMRKVRLFYNPIELE